MSKNTDLAQRGNLWMGTKQERVVKKQFFLFTVVIVSLELIFNELSYVTKEFFLIRAP
jgi:hypothetical protein